MRIQSIILVALLCSVTLADDTPTCEGYLSSTCPADCTFTPDNKAKPLCLSKCLGLSTDDCAKNADCETINPYCLSLVNDCGKISGPGITQTQCTQHNELCSFLAGQTCQPATNNKCKNLTQQVGCQAVAECSFTLTTQSCGWNDQKNTCPQDPQNCGNYCNSLCSSTTTCAGKSQADCTGACSFVEGVCTDTCQGKAADVCGTTEGCQASCAFDQQKAQQQCAAQNSDDLCKGIDICQITSTGTCSVNANQCTADQCNPDTTVCSQPFNPTCNNPDCGNDPQNCAKGCLGVVATCSPQKPSQCLSSFTTKSACESQGCSFIQAGLCSTNNSNSAIVIFSLLSSLIAFMF